MQDKDESSPNENTEQKLKFFVFLRYTLFDEKIGKSSNFFGKFLKIWEKKHKSLKKTDI